MQELILTLVLELIKKVATSNEARDLYDDILDGIEDYIADSETQLDDIFLLPAIKQIRETFDIPDGDD